ncbi:helix-turn-helix domain-containing protein [Paenibacillus cymbidii]|uniref:helix-turn-helix domain-containing protein n=1 Tax=Paenibacillus cymbidii TaxID=1639034 RepID=UPI001436B211|nr:helix-turn-helix domain-containing protein [Paenibacillus cymbidii]
MFDKLLIYSRHKRFLIRLVTYMLLICTIPIVTLVFFFYYNVQSSMKREIEQANARYLKQTANAMELIVNQIGSGYRQFATNKSLLTFDQSPLGDYYSELGQWHNAAESERQRIVDYIDSKAKVLQSLVDLKNLNEFIYSVYYINPNRGIVLTSDHMQYPVGQFYDSNWDEHVHQNAFGYPIMTDVRDAALPNGGVKRVIPIVFRPAQVNYAVVINLDAEAYYRNLISKLGIDRGTTLIVLSPEGEPLLYDNSAAAAPLVDTSRAAIAAADADGRTPGEHAMRHNRWLVSWQSSELLGWTISSVTDMNAMYATIAGIRNLFIVFTALLLLATASLALVSSRRMYKPISRLLQLIKNDHQGDGERKPVGSPVVPGLRTRTAGEFQVISESLTGAYEARNRYRQRLRESLPAYQEKFVRSLLKEHDYGLEAIEERLRYFGVELGTLDIGLLLVAVETQVQWSRHADIEAEKLEQLKVKDSIAESLDPVGTRWVTEIDDHLYAVLLNSGGSGMADVFAAAEAIRRCLHDRHRVACTIGIGGYCRTALELPRAYTEAQESLCYRKLSGEGEIIYIDDVRLQAYDPLPYPKEMEAALVVCLKNGERAKALGVFADMVQTMRAGSRRAAFPQVQHAFLQLLVRLNETVMDLHLDMKAIVPQERPHLLASFLLKNDWQELSVWFEGVIAAMADYIGQAFQEKRNMHVEHARRMVEQDCGDKISLSSVAEALNLNPAYLSRIFKEHTGGNFSDFVTRTRITRSKELLLLPGAKIQDISSQLGYIKVNHFIKLFKESTGLTPGEYRKLHS